MRGPAPPARVVKRPRSGREGRCRGRGRGRRPRFDVDHDLSAGRAVHHGLVGVRHVGEGVARPVQQGAQPAVVHHCCGFAQDLAVVLAALAGQHRQQGEDARVGGSPERQGCQRMGAPAQRAHDMAGVGAHRIEGGVQDRAAHGVIDDVESGAAGVLSDVPLHGNGGVVDRHSPQSAHHRHPGRGDGREHLCTPGRRHLDRDAPHATGTAVHQHLVAGPYAGPVHQAFPCRDHGQGQCGCLAHGQRGRLVGQQAGVDRRELCERALQAADAAGQAVHLVPGSKAVHPGSRFHHLAGQVHAQYRRWPHAGVGRPACADLRVQRVHPAGVDPYQHLSFPRCGRVDLPQLERTGELLQHDRAHDSTLLLWLRCRVIRLIEQTSTSY
ncbi:hypothetical protein RKD41_007172 [Streptomyces tendae]